ncbi:hypothetical protein ACAG26_24370 [Mycobacterium sp. pUA109]|uniref:hypothetical protein n=1 Tax=Mycobacterium sp. pUA109 TaxID=3238982 RepID=UPI00351ADA7A
MDETAAVESIETEALPRQTLNGVEMTWDGAAWALHSTDRATCSTQDGALTFDRRLALEPMSDGSWRGVSITTSNELSSCLAKGAVMSVPITLTKER